MTMIPRFASGTKTAERAPMTMLISPLSAPRQSAARCAPVRRLWSTATVVPKRRLNRDVALRDERDLGNEDESALADAERLLDAAEIHLGLSAPRDAVEKE